MPLISRAAIPAALSALCLVVAACSEPAPERPATPPAPAPDPVTREIQGADPSDQMPELHTDVPADILPDHSGGDVHDHGHATAAIVQDGRMLSVEIASALASFGGNEAEPADDDALAARDALRSQLAAPTSTIDLNFEAACIFTGSDVVFDYSGAHGSANITYHFDCAHLAELETIAFRAFDTFPGLEEVEAVMINESGQEAAILTRSAPVANWSNSTQ